MAEAFTIDHTRGPAHEASRPTGTWGDLQSFPLSFAIVLAVMAWFVTCGTWRIFDGEHFGTFFDSQAEHLLHGRLDVDPEAIGTEAFIVNGKYYGYFGIAPALFRLPLRLLFPEMSGRWSRCSVLFATMVGLVYAYRVLLLLWPANELPGSWRARHRRWLHELFVLCIGLASTSVYMVSRPWMFVEAIVWTSSLSLAFCYYVMRYLRDGSTLTLAKAATMSFFAVQSRATAAGTLLALLLVCGALIARAVFKTSAPALGGSDASARRLWAHASIAAAGVALALGCNLAVNYGRFHTFQGMPLQYYQIYQNDPRMKVMGGKPLHLCNLSMALVNYFSFNNLRVEREVPWLYLSKTALRSQESVICNIEVFCGIPASTPGLFVMACVGAIAAVGGRTAAMRRLRLALLAVAPQAMIVMGCTGLTERYIHDFFPLISLCAAAGFARVGAAPNRMLGRVTVAVLVPLVLLGIAAYSAFALQNGKVAARTPSEREAPRGRPFEGTHLATWLGTDR